MIGIDEINLLVAEIYDAAVDPARWPAIVERLADAMRATVAGRGIYDIKTHACALIAPRNDPVFGCAATLMTEHAKTSRGTRRRQAY